MNDQIRAARALRSTIRTTRQQMEEARRLAPEVVEGLIAGGLFRLAVPGTLGGPETQPELALQIYEELAWADASVAWIVWNNQFVGLASRYSSEAVRSEIFGDDRAIFANSTRPSGRAVVVDGGFNVSGRWSLVSGCELADWIPVMCVVHEADQPHTLADSEPEARMVYLPKGSYRILDTWHVGGLRGTGSHDMVAGRRLCSCRTDLFVQRLCSRRSTALANAFFCNGVCRLRRTLFGSCAGGTRHAVGARVLKGPSRSGSRHA